MTVAESPLDPPAGVPAGERPDPGAAAGGPGRTGRAGRGSRRSPWRQPLAVTGFVVLALWTLVAVFAPALAPYDPDAQAFDTLQAPSGAHLFGTDEVGRDVLSRVLFGARISLPYAVILVVAAMLIGAVLGGLAGYFGGWVDAVVMRLADLVFAFPGIILALAIAAALGPQLRNAVIAVVVVSWPSYARLVRSLVLSARGAQYVVSSRLLGASGLRTLVVDIRPNSAGPVFVMAALDVGNAVLLLSGLSFLGLGAQPPTAEWGAMVAAGAQNFDRWWVGLFPGLAILTVVLAFNFVGDTLRDVLDPRTAREVRA
ncbi:ABC transporter permease [Nakamurella endophytica]|uniref:ABC transporter permease n=1 Tax=Nakamurella endophytica TaxID=1748367 RepID=A0A917WLL1_9ACTN|nr:ABC transporter permease [Nakamurella endophytica]GGM13969.1 ABC transporter permease [Nakamurella endophytica]